MAVGGVLDRMSPYLGVCVCWPCHRHTALRVGSGNTRVLVGACAMYDLTIFTECQMLATYSCVGFGVAEIGNYVAEWWG